VQLPRFTVLAVVVGTVGSIAGCGSSSSTSASSTPAASSSPPASTTPAAAAPAPHTASAALITTKHGKLGTILAYGPKKMTVYLFEADKGQASTCTGECAIGWPPVIGKPQAGGAAKASDLGTITRPDGATQVTYRGHPLYRFIKDKDDGDAYGQGSKAFGAGWYVLTPSGVKVDNS
jgi:predicted lipoprotein with Yx(FWY)xxD motif